MENLEEDLTCSVCYSLFTDPRVLPCSHTFCRSCLDSVLQVSVNFSIWRPLRLPLKCPNCRSVVELPTNGVEALPVNVCLRAIVEKYQRDGRPRSADCPEHPRQPLNVYCLQDRKLICGFCLTVGQHQGHAIDDLQTAFLKERAAQGQLLESLRGQHWEEVCGLAERLQREKACSEALLQKDREVVSRFFQGLHLLLAEKREQFLGALEGASALLSQTYDPLVQQLKELQEERSDLMSLSSRAEDEDCPLVYLEHVHQLRERVNALNDKVLPQVPRCDLAPRAEEFIEERWAGITIGGLRDAPVPHISCHTHRCWMNSTEPDQRRFWRFRLSSLCVALLVFVPVLAVLCLNSTGFSVSSGLSHIAEHVSCELTQPLHDMGTYLLCILHNTHVNFSSYISAVENTCQQLLTFFSTLH